MATPAPQRPDRDASLAQYRRRAPHYDQELMFFEPVRRHAIAALRLAPGATVLDVGCGTGLSFELLRRGVGASGHIVGVEQSPEMLAQARERVRGRHWHNVELVQAPAATAALHCRGDAALFHFTHDILRDDAAIENVLAHLKSGARVVASGLRWAPPWLWPTNAFVLGAALYSVTALDGLDQAWDKLAPHLSDFTLESTFLGGIFIAAGRLRPSTPIAEG
jgi:demethylmenaquinone methyltransferase/2-methoxy-6-polyprenyl-1,4-benzoquinol methylase